MKNLLTNWTITLLAITAFGLTACSNDDKDELIPEGTYIDEDMDPYELFTLNVKGNTIIWTCTSYGEIEELVEYTYEIKGNKITTTSKYGTETFKYSHNGNNIVIGEITYIKQ
ncbi:MAG: hypothetical protein IKP63_03630 [Paludibacteraceae bacterium]|nr:hypothetical protein [Paludibacteraceae bacterium]